MNSFCRICAKKKINLVAILEHEMLSLKILRCLHVHVTVNDFLPVMICHSCFYQVERSYDLFEKCSKAEKTLKKIWKSLVEKAGVESGDFGGVDTQLVLSNQNNPINDGYLVISRDSAGSGVIVLPPDVKEKGNFEISSNQCTSNKVNAILEDLGTSAQASSSKKGISSKSQKVFECSICKKQFSSSTSLNIHKATHSDVKPYLCDTCGKAFRHANNLKCHSRTHNPIRQNYCVCQVCSKGFCSKFFLKEHMNNHLGETPYKCDQCGKAFYEKVHLRQHMWTHSNKTFKCPHCDSNFNRKGNMSEHVKKFHLTVSRDQTASKSKNHDVNDTKVHKEPEEPNITKKPEDERLHSCSLCSKQFKAKGSLTYHRRAAHTGEKPFRCTFCPKAFALRSVQKIHERKQHTGERPFKCPHCSSYFADRSSFTNHSFVHKGKLFTCNDCGKKFARKGSLEIHKKQHAGIKPYQCQQCDKKFVQKNDMLKHEKSHDPSRTPFFCKFCGNSFAKKKDVAKHSHCALKVIRKQEVVDNSTAEKILDSVTSAFRRNASSGLFEEDILDSVQQFSNNR